MKTRTMKLVRKAVGEISKPKHEGISRLAYDLCEREGRPDGKDLEHWFNAESMIESQFGYGSDHAEHDFSKTTGDE